MFSERQIPEGTTWTAGMTRRRYRDDRSGLNFPLSIWYPAREQESTRRRGAYAVSAAVDAPPAPGSFGLIAISHGSGGGEYNHHDWAAVLARSGFVVAAPLHSRDPHDALRGEGSVIHILERPRQLRAALETAMADAVLGPHIDGTRPGVAGFSAGGNTALLLLGARPMYAMNGDVQAEREWRNIAMPELGAAAIFAPFARFFTPEGLADVSAAVRLYRAADDEITVNADHADLLASRLPRPPEIVTLPGGHFVFLAPAVEEIAAQYPQYYRDRPGVDRAAVHGRIGGELVDFFQRALPSRRV